MQLINKTYTTKMETLEYSVAEILDEKLKATSPAQTVDYLAFALDNLTSNIARAKEAISELKEYIEAQSSIVETIKTDSAKWLSDAGIDKLEGIRVSSMTIHEPAPMQKLIITDKDYFLGNKEFTKISLDETKIKNFLLNTEIDYSEYATIETTHNQPLIKINMRKVKKDDKQ